MRRCLWLLLAILVSACLPALPEVSSGDEQEGAGAPGYTAGRCGSGSWRPGWLEIHHINAGEAVSTLIVSPSGRSLLLDAGESLWDQSSGALTVGAYVRSVLGCAALDYVVLSHFHLDHVGYPGYGGVWHLVHVQGFAVGKLLHRDLFRYVGVNSSTLAAWQAYLQSQEAQRLHPEVAIPGTAQIDLGPSTAFAIIAVDGAGVLAEGDFSADATPPDENDYSLVALLRVGRLDYVTAGDLSGETVVSSTGGYTYHDIETPVAARVKDVDVYRVSHHGSSHASNVTWLAELAPRVSILQVGSDNQNGHPAQATVDRLLASGTLYLTEPGDSGTALGSGRVVGHVVLRTATGLEFTVNGDGFAAHDPLRVDADGDGYFDEVDPDDDAGLVGPALQGGCDVAYQACR